MPFRGAVSCFKITQQAVSLRQHVGFSNPLPSNEAKFNNESSSALTTVFGLTEDAASPPKSRFIQAISNSESTQKTISLQQHNNFPQPLYGSTFKTTTNRMPHWRLPLDRLLMTTCCRKVISLDGFPTPKRLDRPYRHNNMSHFQVLYVGAGLNSMKNWLILWQELYLLWRMMCHHRRNAITVEPFPAKHYATCRISATTSLFSKSFALERA